MNVFLLTGQLTPSRGGHDGSFNSIPKVVSYSIYSRNCDGDNDNVMIVRKEKRFLMILIEFVQQLSVVFARLITNGTL
ncbi:hypothetical protein MTR_6g086885 [Medicago truncatula]|uniref:Uncharacterized protein n=1 Tax=Medicago truncatula TaxID=3880 RepID=A0A072UMN8_MEDTR|nr:hypothetical protein MTR_6g086885 [Medicago truncatula]